MSTAELVRPALYVRVGRLDDTAQAKADRQRQECRDYAQQMGWTPPREYIDLGNARTPQFQALVDDIHAGAITHLVVEDFDRMPRISTVTDLRDVEVHTASLGRLDPFILKVAAVMADATAHARSQRARRRVQP